MASLEIGTLVRYIGTLRDLMGAEGRVEAFNGTTQVTVDFEQMGNRRVKKNSVVVIPTQDNAPTTPMNGTMPTPTTVVHWPTTHEIRSAKRHELGSIVRRLGLQGVIPTAGGVRGRTQAAIEEEIFAHPTAQERIAAADALTNGTTAAPAETPGLEQDLAELTVSDSPRRKLQGKGLGGSYPEAEALPSATPTTIADLRTVRNLKEDAYQSDGQRVEGLSDQLVIGLDGKGDEWFPGNLDICVKTGIRSGFTIQHVEGFPNGPLSAFEDDVVVTVGGSPQLEPNPASPLGALELQRRSNCKGVNAWRRAYFFAYGGTHASELTRVLDLSKVASIRLEVSDYKLNKKHQYERVLCDVELRPVEMCEHFHSNDGLDETFIGATKNGDEITRFYLHGKQLVKKKSSYDEETDGEKVKEDPKPKSLGSTLRLSIVKEMRMELPMKFDTSFDQALLEGKQLCADLDATAEVWNGVVLSIQRERVHCSRDASSGAVTTEWKVKLNGRFGFGSHAHYVEKRDSEGKVRQAFKSLWDGMKEGILVDTKQTLESTLGRRYVDTLWYEAPQVFVWGRPSTPKAATWVNEKMLHYNVISDDGAGSPNTAYIDYVYAM